MDHAIALMNFTVDFLLFLNFWFTPFGTENENDRNHTTWSMQFVQCSEKSQELD